MVDMTTVDIAEHSEVRKDPAALKIDILSRSILYFRNAFLCSSVVAGITLGILISLVIISIKINVFLIILTTASVTAWILLQVVINRLKCLRTRLVSDT